MPKLTKKRLRKAALALCIAVAVLSAGMLLRNAVLIRREAEQNRHLQERMASARQLAEETPLPEDKYGPPYMEILPQYQELHQENEDFWGWLTIPGTPIDYPMMFTPEEPEYYLHRAFDKQYAYSGCLFFGEGTYPRGSHLLIYGHNMEDNETMFSTLPLYADPEYWREHPEITFDTATRQGTFRVMAAFYSKAYQGEGAFRYHLYPTLDHREVYEEYIRLAKESALYDTGVTGKYGQRVLTLSTCSTHTRNGRFAVIAVEVPPEGTS